MGTIVAYGNLIAKVMCMWLLLTLVLKLVQGGQEVTVPRPIRYHNLIWITYVHLVTCPVDPCVHLDAGHTNIRLSLTHTVCPCAVSYAPTWIGAMNHAVLC